MSKQPLTGLCFGVAISLDDIDVNQLPENPLLKQAGETKSVFGPIKIKLVHTKDNSSVLYAEAGADFLDILFGLLAVPLGSVIRTHGLWSPNGCIDSLYRSVDGSAKACVRQERRSLLLTPNLAPFFGCSRNVLQADELKPSLTFSCFSCRRIAGGKKCGCTMPVNVTLHETNPKSPGNGSDNTAKAYVKGGLRNFLVTNDLHVSHFSLANTPQVMRAAKIPKEKLVEEEFALDKTQVLKLLRAAMLSRDALTSLLLPSHN